MWFVYVIRACTLYAVPMRVFLQLRSAAEATPKKGGGDTSIPVTVVVIKRWLSVLVKRSLMLELIRGSIHLHDIGSIIFIVHRAD